MTRKRVFDIIQIGQKDDLASRLFDYALVAVILINISVMFMSTFDVFAPYKQTLDVIELATLVFFMVEYGLRIWTADYLFPGVPKRRAVLEFLISFDGVVDLLTILPFFYLSGFVVFRMMRVVRIFHLFRINASYDSFNVIFNVLNEKRNQILSSLFIILVLTLASSLCIYSVEHEAQPGVFKNAFSGIWWSLSTLFTVGYGDIYPITPLGKLMGAVIEFLGVGAVAIPTGIISAGFYEQYTRAQEGANALEFVPQCVVVDIDSKWLGMSAKEVEDNFDVKILLVRRDDAVFVPGESWQVAMKDELIVYNGMD